MQPQLLEDSFGIPGKLLVIFIRAFRMRELYQLNLLELVLADNATHILSIGSGFAAKAWSVTGYRNGKAALLKRLFAVEVGKRHLGRGYEPEVMILDAEKVPAKFGELSGAVHRSGIHHIRRQYFRVAVPAGMKIEHEIRQRSFQPGALIEIHGKARARKLGSPLEIENPKLLA